jgi:hypothetical protein
MRIDSSRYIPVTPLSDAGSFADLASVGSGHTALSLNEKDSLKFTVHNRTLSLEWIRKEPESDQTNRPSLTYINASIFASLCEDLDGTLPNGKSNREIIDLIATRFLDPKLQKAFGAPLNDIVTMSLREDRLRLQLNKDFKGAEVELLRFHSWNMKSAEEQDDLLIESDIVSLRKCYVLVSGSTAVLLDLSRDQVMGNAVMQLLEQQMTTGDASSSLASPLTVISELYEQVLKNQDATATALKSKLESLNSHLHFDALSQDQLSTLERSFAAHQGDLSIAVGKLVEHESTVKQTLALFCKMLDKTPGLEKRWVMLATRNMKEDYRLFEGSVEEAKEDLLTLTRTILSFNQYKNELQKAQMQRQKMKLTARAEEANFALQHSNFAVAQTNLAVQRAILLLAVPVTAASALQIGIADTPQHQLTTSTKLLITAASFVVSGVIAAVSYWKASRALKEQLNSIENLEAQRLLDDTED